MKKLKRMIAVISATILSALSLITPATVSAFDIHYLMDMSNVAWTKGDMYVYNNGSVNTNVRMFYDVVVKPAEGVSLTTQTLGISDEYMLSQHTLLTREEEDPDWISINTETLEETLKIAKLSEKWISEGLITDIKIRNNYTCGCASNFIMTVVPKDTSDETLDLNSFAGLEYTSFTKSEDGVYTANILNTQELVNLNEITETLKADERIENVSFGGTFCDVLHYFFNYKDVQSFEYGIPSDFMESMTFGKEFDVTSDGKHAVVVVPYYESVEYRFTDDGEGTDYVVKSYERYKAEGNVANDDVESGYDVYFIELKSDKDIDIQMNLFKGEENLNEPSLDCISFSNRKFGFVRNDDGTYKVSDIYKIGNVDEIGINVNEDNVVISAGSGCIYGTYEISGNKNYLKPIKEKFQSVSNEAFDVYREDGGEISLELTCGGGSYDVSQYRFDENGEYSIRYICGSSVGKEPFTDVKIYNYIIEKTDEGIELKESFVEEREAIVRGDVNCDAVIDLYDAVGVSKYLINPKNLTDAEVDLSDFNEDYKVDLYDVIDIVKTFM